MTDPTAPSGSNGKNPTNISTSVDGLGAISEHSLLREQSTSPEPIPEDTAYFDFQDGRQQQPQSSRQSSTNQPLAEGPAEENEPNPSNKANKARTYDKKIKSVPPISNKNKLVENQILGQIPRRHSTNLTQNSESFAETAVWDQKAILSLDGGGIRGYSALSIIQKLMEAIGRLETASLPGPNEADGPAESSYHPLRAPPRLVPEGAPPDKQNVAGSARTASSPWLPCHYFDYMAGTSTGGLIAIMLGRLRMNIDDCIKEYEILGAKVFGHSRWFHLRSPFFWPRDKYNHKVLQEIVRDVVKRYIPKVADFPGGRNFAFDENRCRVLVVAIQKQRLSGVEPPYLFRTYENLHKSEDPEAQKFDRNPAQAHDVPIWQVARATAAAPTYFKPVVIDGLEYVDGGFGATNNPCEEIYDEVRKMNNNAKKCAKIIVSVGTGKNNKISRMQGQGLSRYWNYLNFAMKWATDSERTHGNMIKAKNALDPVDRFRYRRFNVEHGLDTMKLDEWRARHPLKTNLGAFIGKMKSRKARARPKNAGQPGAEARESESAEEKEERSQNRNGDSEDEVPPDSRCTLEHVQRESNSPSSGRPNAASVNEAKENGTFIHVDDATTGRSPTDDDLADIPKWLLPKNKTIKTIRKHTEAYLGQEHVRGWIEECAKILVDGRRDRARSNKQRWERVCFGAWYQCKVPGCPRGEKKYLQEKDIVKHLLDKHGEKFGRVEDSEELEKILEICKKVVR